jgi:hypothetical protein
MDILIDQFELKQIGRFRGVMNADDVIGILHHHWVLCNDYYPEERQRLQHAVTLVPALLRQQSSGASQLLVSDFLVPGIMFATQSAIFSLFTISLM